MTRRGHPVKFAVHSGRRCPQIARRPCGAEGRHDVNPHCYEIVDGALVVTPSPDVDHEIVSDGVRAVIRAALPRQYAVIGRVLLPNNDVDERRDVSGGDPHGVQAASRSGGYAEVGTWTAGQTAHFDEPFRIDVPIDRLTPGPAEVGQ